VRESVVPSSRSWPVLTSARRRSRDEVDEAACKIKKNKNIKKPLPVAMMPERGMGCKSGEMLSWGVPVRTGERPRLTTTTTTTTHWKSLNSTFSASLFVCFAETMLCD